MTRGNRGTPAGCENKTALPRWWSTRAGPSPTHLIAPGSRTVSTVVPRPSATHPGTGWGPAFARLAVTGTPGAAGERSEEHTSELQSRENIVCRLLLEKKKGHQHYIPDMLSHSAFE